MLAQRDSILLLLGDEDSDTWGLVQNQLIARGLEILEDLRGLLPVAKGRAERRLKEVIAQIARDDAERRFGEMCATFDEHSDIEEAAWLIADVLLPGEDFTGLREQIDSWARELARRLADKETVVQQAATVAEYLGDELRFHGNEDDYYAEDNSLLPRVIVNRFGNPITLSLVYLAVGRRAGLAIQGVGLPGHFVVRLGGVFFDPFHSGHRLQLEDCQKLLESQGLELQPHHLQPCKRRVMLARILNNLLHTAESGDPKTAEKLLGWLQILQRATV
jgi:regulator of sirC expression with transglutaminase-like and TPR domain